MKYRIIHDRISPTQDVLSADELQEYLSSYARDDADWREIAESFQADDDGAYAIIDGQVTAIAEPVK